MKKVLVLLLGIALVFSLAGTVSAADVPGTPDNIATNSPLLDAGQTGVSEGIITGSKESAVYVWYSVGVETYEVTIPGDVTFGTVGKKLETAVEVTSLTLTEGRTLNLTVNSTHGWKLEHHGDNGQLTGHNMTYEMTYTPINGDAPVVATGTDKISLLKVTSKTFDEARTNALTFTLKESAPTTGTFKDRLTFTVTIE